jgi:hypothetical protein
MTAGHDLPHAHGVERTTGLMPSWSRIFVPGGAGQLTQLFLKRHGQGRFFSHSVGDRGDGSNAYRKRRAR